MSEAVRPLTQQVLNEAKTLVSRGMCVRKVGKKLGYEKFALGKRPKIGFDVDKVGRS